MPSAEHTAAEAKWQANRQAANAVNPQAAPFNTWILYRLRFICASDLFGAWAEFGGIAAQLNSVSILLHIVTTESIAASLIYDGLISTHLGDLDRPRANKKAGAVDFADLMSNEHSRFKIQAVSQSRPAVATALVAKKEQKGEKERVSMRV